jgi:hypothetical protein
MIISTAFALLMLLSQNAPSGNASIRGRITAAGTQAPMSRVAVELQRVGTLDAPFTTATTEDGSFAFTNLGPGQYRLSATRSNYVPGEFGQRRPGGPGVPLALAAGQQLRDVRMELTLSASITGRVFFRTGRPVVNAEVMAMKVSYQEGRRILTLVQTARTNDLGEYRLYWLTPGRYYIGSTPWDGRPISSGVVMNASGAPAAVDMARMTVLAGDVARAPLGFQPGAPPSDTEAWIPMYFPSATNEDAASPVEVQAGTSVRGIDLVIAPIQPRRVRGTVIDALGQPVPGAQLQRSNNGSGSNTYVTDMVDPTRGTFDIRGVVPGTYTLVATSGDRAGRIVLNVGETDLDDVRISVAAGVSISGRVGIEGRAASAGDPALAGLRISLRPDPLVPAMQIPASAVTADGSFLLNRVLPGRYLVTVQPLQPAPPAATGQRGNAFPLPPAGAQQRGGAAVPVVPALQNAYVKAVRLGAVDILSNGLNIEGAIDGQLEIVIGSNPGSIEGSVGPVPNITVVLVPADRARRPDLYRSVTTDVSGAFAFRNVAPGDYTVFAWDDVESGAWLNEAFLRSFEGRGRNLRVDDGQRQTLQLTVIE